MILKDVQAKSAIHLVEMSGDSKVKGDLANYVLALYLTTYSFNYILLLLKSNYHFTYLYISHTHFVFSVFHHYDSDEINVS